jgi:hypothetical protein
MILEADTSKSIVQTCGKSLPVVSSCGRKGKGKRAHARFSKPGQNSFLQQAHSCEE